MAIRTVFSDDNNNEMDCYLNTDGKLYLSVGQSGEDQIYSGFITLDKSDVKEFIGILSQLEKLMSE